MTKEQEVKAEQLELTVVFPCLDEAQTLAECVRRAKKAMEDNDIVGEVVVSDNGSTDGSQDIARAEGARVVPAEKKGYGHALFAGFSAARGTYIIHMDSDLSYPIHMIPDYVKELRKGPDFVMGSRLKGKIEPGAMPFLHRHLGTPVLTGIANLFFGCGISDVNCGMRGLTKDAFERLGLRTGGMEFASEMIIKATLLKMNITEIPIDFAPDQRDRPPHLRTFRDGWRHLRFMLLFSPTWLFFLPGLFMILAGIGTIVAILFDVSPSVGLATCLLAHASAVLGVQTVLLGVAAQGFVHLARLHVSNVLPKLYEWLRDEKGLVFGGFLSLAGLSSMGYAFFRIKNFMNQSSYVPQTIDVLSTKVALVGVTFFIVGVQILFASFFMSLFTIEAEKVKAED